MAEYLYLHYWLQPAVGARFALHEKVGLYFEVGGAYVVSAARERGEPEPIDDIEENAGSEMPEREFGAGFGLGLEVRL